MSELHGIVVVDKPTGMTSAAVVARVKRALGARRVGHTGTLDPMATGVLPICVGEATKIAGYLLAADKEYDGELVLGAETDTLDREGAVTRRDPDAATRVSERGLREAMAGLVGPGQQVPPMYSALKRDGKRLFELARSGLEVERAPRAVDIASFDLRAFDPPAAAFSVACSKGTYVRSLVSDLGRRLGCGAHLTELCRTRAGAFGIEEARSLRSIETGVDPDQVISLPDAIAHMPQVVIAAGEVGRVANGQEINWRDIMEKPPPDEVVAVLTPGRALLALVRVKSGRLAYERVFRYGLT